MVASINVDGQYMLEFASNLGFKGSGLVTLENGQFRGNNASYEWVGSYEVKDGELSAEIKTKQFSGGVSIFGLVPEFSLVVTGRLEDNKMTLTGYRKEEPSDKVVVLMTRKAELS